MICKKSHFKITHYTYQNPKLGKGLDGCRIAFISDFHSAAYVDEVVSALRDLSPHMIAITGDLFDRHRPAVSAPAFSLLHRALTLAPTYFAEGNHERKIESYPRWRRQMRDMGVRILDNETAIHRLDDAALRVIGLKDTVGVQTLAHLIRPAQFNLVLSHRVEKFPLYAQAGADLALCGHAHGGQARPFGIGLYAPQQGPFPKYTRGVYRQGPTTMIASAGLGNGTFPRFFNPPELVCVVLLR